MTGAFSFVPAFWEGDAPHARDWAAAPQTAEDDMADDFTGADISSAMSGGGTPAPTADATVQPTTEPTAQPGAATTQPAAAPTTQQPAKPQGPIPFEEHKKILENARKEREEWDKQYGWAKSLSKADYDAAVALAKRANTDPVGYIRELIAEIQQHPQHGPALRSEAARTLAAGRAAPTMPQPNVEITDAAGNVIGRTYDADGLAKRDAWLKDQILTEIRGEMKPVVQTHETIKEQRQREHDEAEGQKFATGLMGELKDYPHFEANKKEIGADVVQQIQRMGDDPRTNDPAWLEAATLRAYHRVVTTKQDALSRQAAVHDLTTKAHNNGAVPGRPPVGAPKSSANGTFTGADIAAEFAKRKIG